MIQTDGHHMRRGGRGWRLGEKGEGITMYELPVIKIVIRYSIGNMVDNVVVAMHSTE